MSEPGADAPPGPERLLAATLSRVLREVDQSVARDRDPVRFAHAYAAPRDRELVALFAALLAYGRVALIGRALDDFVRRAGASPADAAAGDTRAEALSRFEGFVFRFTRGVDLARVWLGAGAIYRGGRTLEQVFVAADRSGPPGSGDLRPALAGLRSAILAPTADFPARRAFEHFFPAPARGSAAKRLCLFLRWMVRGPDAIDLGLWREVDAARLTMPVDTHIHRLGVYLGLTRRSTADARAADEITAALRRIDPSDPLRFDFALTHLGISGACARRRVPSICERCPLDAACRLGPDGRIVGSPVAER